MGSTAKESLEMMRALSELTEGLKEAAPLLYRTCSEMLKATSRQDAMGYFNAAQLIDKASVDEKDAMLLLATQWICSVLTAASHDQLLKDILSELFPDSKLLLLTPGCIITEL